MTEEETIIFGFGDKELLRFHGNGAIVPPELTPRLEMLLKRQQGDNPPRKTLRFRGEAHEPRVPWVESTSAGNWRRRYAKIKAARKLAEVA